MGSFPREVGFFKDGVSYGEGYDGEYNQQSLSVTNLYYKYLQFATNSLHDVPSTESLNFKVG